MTTRKGLRLPEDIVGYVLSGSSSTLVRFQLTLNGEKVLQEGMLVVVGHDKRVIARIEALKPINTLFTEGDEWSEARRRGQIPRIDVGGYVVAEAVILGESQPGGGLGEPSRPPWPGEPVYLLGKKGLQGVLGLSHDEPGVVWFGELVGYQGAGVPLSVENITMHLGVFGETGSGKSYAVGYLIELLSRIPLGGGEHSAFPIVVVDANGDYLDYHERFSKGERIGEYRLVLRLVFPGSMARYKPYTRLLTISLDGFSVREIAEFVIAYRSGGVEINELQVSLLERALREFEGIYGFTELLTKRLGELLDAIDSLSRGPGAMFHAQTGRAVKSAVEKLYQDLVKGYKILSIEPSLDEKLIDEVTLSPSLVILDYSPEGAPGIPLPVKQLVLAYLARLLYKRFTDYKTRGDERYLGLVIEEAQNYAPNSRTYPVAWSIARDYLSLIATQGRKFGISLVLVSQRPSFVDPVVVSMLNTFIVFRSAPDDVAYISKATGGLPQPLREKLTRLPRGVALVSGQMNLLGFPVLVRTGSRSVGHKMGRTRVVEALKRLKRAGRQ